MAACVQGSTAEDDTKGEQEMGSSVSSVVFECRWLVDVPDHWGAIVCVFNAEAGKGCEVKPELMPEMNQERSDNCECRWLVGITDHRGLSCACSTERNDNCECRWLVGLAGHWGPSCATCTSARATAATIASGGWAAWLGAHGGPSLSSCTRLMPWLVRYTCLPIGGHGLDDNNWIFGLGMFMFYLITFIGALALHACLHHRC